MLAYIKGSIQHRYDSGVIVVAHDLGYRVSVIDALRTKKKEGDQIELYLYQYVRESQIELYGFETSGEFEFFEQLLSVSGVGPKTALSILNAARVEKLQNAIADGDAAIFKGVSGVGMKTAERIILELRGSFQKLSGVSVSSTGDDSDIIEALIHLGYTPVIARHTVQAMPEAIIGVEERMKAALKSLGK